MTSPLPGSIHFGKVVGRVVHLEADTPEDTDALPQARAAVGRVTFVPQVVMSRALDTDYSAIVLTTRANALLSPTGRVMDAEGRDGIWLALGIYKVQFEITGSSRVIPDFDIEVTEAHTAEAPLDLAAAAPYAPPPSAVVQTLPVPPGGEFGQVLARAADGGTMWTSSRAPMMRIAAHSINPRQTFVNNDWKSIWFNELQANSDQAQEFFEPVLWTPENQGRCGIRVKQDGVYGFHFNVTWNTTQAPTTMYPETDPRKLSPYARTGSAMRNEDMLFEGNPGVGYFVSHSFAPVACQAGDLLWVVCWVEAEPGETMWVSQDSGYQTGMDLVYLGAL